MTYPVCQLRSVCPLRNGKSKACRSTNTKTSSITKQPLKASQPQMDLIETTCEASWGNDGSGKIHIFFGVAAQWLCKPRASHVATQTNLFSKFLPWPYLHQTIESAPMHQRVPHIRSAAWKLRRTERRDYRTVNTECERFHFKEVF